MRREVVDGDLTKSDPLPFNQGREDARDCALHVSSVLAIDEPRRAWVVLAATESSFGCQGDHRSIYADPRRPASTLLAASLAAGGRPHEIVTDGVDGLLFEPGDIRGVASCLSTLGSDQNLLASLSNAARHRSLARFLMEDEVEQFSRLLGSVAPKDVR